MHFISNDIIGVCHRYLLLKAFPFRLANNLDKHYNLNTGKNINTYFSSILIVKVNNLVLFLCCN